MPECGALTPGCPLYRALLQEVGTIPRLQQRLKTFQFKLVFAEKVKEVTDGVQVCSSHRGQCSRHVAAQPHRATRPHTAHCATRPAASGGRPHPRSPRTPSARAALSPTPHTQRPLAPQPLRIQMPAGVSRGTPARRTPHCARCALRHTHTSLAPRSPARRHVATPCAPFLAVLLRLAVLLTPSLPAVAACRVSSRR